MWFVINPRPDTVIVGAQMAPEVKYLESNTLESFKLSTPSGVFNLGASSVPTKPLSPQSKKSTNDMLQIDPTIGILSPFKQNDTARSSGDSHVMTISSNDTILSEYPTSGPNRLQLMNRRSSHNASFLKPPQPSKMTEVLMMGYAQINGFFTIDGSLIKQQPFEHIKRKCVIGGQSGGGIIRAEKQEQQSRILNNLIWGNLGDSITEFLKGGDLERGKNLKETAGLPSIPILSTPQSVLFVDLKVEPGQSITYTYRFPLPNALPPTHKGRAIRIHYYLTIGIQRAASSALRQQISTVDVPFKVITGTAGETYFRALSAKADKVKKKASPCRTT